MSRPRPVELLRVGVLALLAFVLAHELAYLVTYPYSYDAVLAMTGHGGHWMATVVTVSALATVLAVAGLRRIVVLSRLARDLDPTVAILAPARPGDLWRHVATAWPLVLAGAAALFIGVENLEHLAVGLPAPGLAVIVSSEVSHVPLILAAVSLAVALVEGLYRWRRDVLVARIAAARARWARAAFRTPRWQPDWVDRRHPAIAGHHLAGRAPPLPAS